MRGWQSSGVADQFEQRTPDIMGLIARAAWREAVTYREAWPHEYVVVKRDGQQALLAAMGQVSMIGGSS